jgi:hypothetical protein
MAKKSNGFKVNPLILNQGEQTSIRLLLAAREQATAVAQASVNAVNNSVRGYLIQILTTRGLDPAKWGISPDMTTIIEIVQPPAAAPGAPDAPPIPGGPQTFAQTAPPPTPAALPPPATPPVAVPSSLPEPTA